MFKPRSPFMPPQAPGSKKQKKNMSIQQRGCSLEKTQEKPKIKTSSYGVLQPGQLGSTGQFQERFAFDLSTPIQDDDQIYWQYPLSNQVSNQYMRKIIFRQQQYFIRGVESGGVVNSISIQIENMQAYLDKSGISTQTVCVLQLSNQYPVLDDIGQKSYDLVYKQTQDVAWDIPMSMTALRVRIKADGVALQGPLNIPLLMLFDIRHIGR